MSRRDDYQELDSLRKQCGEYKETIVSQANEIRDLRRSLSDNVCQRCKSNDDSTNFKKPGRVTTNSSVSGAVNPVRKATNFLSSVSDFIFHSPPSDGSNTHPSASIPCVAPSSRQNTLHIAAPHGSAMPPSQLSSLNDIDIATSPAIIFKKGLDVKLLHSFKHKWAVHCIRFTPDGRHLAAICGSATHIYDVQTWKSICVLQDISQRDGNGEMNGVSFSVDGKYLATASTDMLIRVWEISRRRVRCVFRGHRDFVGSLDFSPDGRLLASTSYDGTVRTWSMRDGTSKALASIGDRTYRSFYSVAFSPDGMYIAAGGDYGVLGIWDVQTRQLFRRLEGHNRSVRSVLFTPGSKGLVSGGRDNTLKYWDASLQMDERTGKDKIAQNNRDLMVKGLPSFLNFRGHTDYVNSVSISSNGRWVASGSRDESLRIWDARNAETQCILRAHNSIRSVHLSPVGNYLASSENHGWVRIWSFKEV